ncbi:hypothetical protein LSM04_008139 [Trypanosoma melophagium]|uniref:uncharacterized protein n=1 Tax=Trypanosoma melophagium TaxID=715481 RepID=UPI00351A0B81|nr:hypothetical protein LSM04_008139 [Trypanosoma melophagium]
MSFFRKVRALFQQDESLPTLQQVRTSSSSGGGNGGIDTRSVKQQGAVSGGPSIWPVHFDVQRKIQEGTDMNIKAVVRGMRQTGKSTIVSWLCGYTPPRTYIPSAEISAGTIYYHSRMVKSGRGGAKVELWDVVDEGFRAKGSSSISNSSPLADARSIDVYRGCNLVIFVVDRTRKETLEYAVREAHHVPPTTCILFALNFHDAPKDTHVVLDRDIDNACKSLRRATTPMILAACAGRVPPEDSSASVTWVDISAITGYGMELLRTAFEIPYLFLRVLDLESQINSHFRCLERYQAWVFTERANLHLLEKSERAEIQEGKEKVLLGILNNPSEKNSEGSSMKTLGKEVNRFSLNTVGGHYVKYRLGDGEEDENGITEGFFDGLEEDEAVNDTKKEETSFSIDNSISVNESGKASKTQIVSPSPPLSMGKESLGTPILTKINLLDTETESRREEGKLGNSLFYGQEKMFDVGEDVDLDDAFFEASTRDEPLSVGTSLPLENNADNKEDEEESNKVVTKLRVVDEAEAVLATTSIVQEVSNVSAIQVDVDVLLRQMQSALGVACDEGTRKGTEENARQIRQGKQKSHNRQKGKRNGKRNKNYIDGEQEERDGKLFNTDDGTFELIKE